MPAPRFTRGDPRWRIGLIWLSGPALVGVAEDGRVSGNFNPTRERRKRIPGAATRSRPPSMACRVDMAPGAGPGGGRRGRPRQRQF